MILCLSLILLAIIFRSATPFLGGLSNIAPLMAITYCAAVYLPRTWAFLIPPTALLISDLFLNHHYGVNLLSGFMLANYFCYLLATTIGLWVSHHKKISTLLIGCLSSSLLFYLITNSLAWLTNPAYPVTLGGWLQALSVGDLIHQPQTWVFLRNSLLSDLLFTTFFVTSMEYCATRSGRPSLFRPHAQPHLIQAGT
jgi:hypothetical protein